MLNLLDELAAEEIRKDRIREAQAHNLVAGTKENKLAHHFYLTLGKLGTVFENWGVKLQQRYTYHECPDNHDLLVKSAK